MKKIVGVMLVLLLNAICRAQSPVYTLNAEVHTASESNTLVVAGFIKSNLTCQSADSVFVVIKGGNPRFTHCDTSSFIARFNIGQDSVPFFVRLYDDTLPENPDQIQYVLRNYGSAAVIGSDSILNFTILDNDLPATVGHIVDSMSVYEDEDSFYNGSYFQYYKPFFVGITINNPNPFCIRYYADNYDCFRRGPFPYLNACGVSNFYYNGETCYAPPGLSTYYKRGYVIDENMASDKYFVCYLQNIDANIINDTFTFFTIKHVNFFDTPSLSFDASTILRVGDTLVSIAIPVTIDNPNRKPLYFRIDTLSSSSTYPGINFTFNNQLRGYGHGITRDTFLVNFIRRQQSGDTISMFFVLRNDSANASPDTLLHITIIDTSHISISFLGAGMAHLKSDSIGYVSLYSSSIAKYPVYADVRYLNGSATPGVDFIFHDTTVVFPAYSYDTITLPVIMLHDHVREGNEQVNLQLLNVSPASVVSDIIQYTYTIIDDDSTALLPNGIDPSTEDLEIQVYPNPVSGRLHIKTTWTVYDLTISNTLGDTVQKWVDMNGDINADLTALPAGIYVLNAVSKDRFYRVKLVKR